MVKYTQKIRHFVGLALKELRVLEHFLNLFNPFQVNRSFRYPLKILENLWFSEVFREYKKGTLAWNRLKCK